MSASFPEHARCASSVNSLRKEGKSVRHLHTNSLTLNSGHTRCRLVAGFGLLATQLLPYPLLSSPAPSLLSLGSSHSSTVSLCGRERLCRVSDVLLGGFRPVPGSGLAASGHLLYHVQPAASFPHGRNHLHPTGPLEQIHLVLWWTRRRRNSGE